MLNLKYIVPLFLSLSVFGQDLEVLKIKKFRTAVLNDSIQETSGLTFVGPDLFTINDSGNPSSIFKVNTKSGTIKRQYETNLRNLDWEAITSDGDNIYVGDFGNNAGTRKDLKIYKLPFRKDEIIADSLTAIGFYYPEQEDFTPKNLNTNYDAEALFYLNEKLHILTKEWVTKSVSHYTVDPKKTELQAAEKLESYPTGFVVTDAFYYDNKLYTVGYTKGLEVFMMIFETEDGSLFFNKKPRKLFLGNALSVGQVEGIAVNHEGIYISSERFRSPLSNTKPYLYFIPHEKIK